MTTNPPTYTPPLRLAGRACAGVLPPQPERGADPADMAEKFNVEYGSVAQGLKPALDAGLLVKVKSQPSRRVVYRLPDLLTRGDAA